MELEFKVTVVLPASGNGERFNSYPPKQFTRILDRPLILHTIFNFHRFPWVDKIIVVVSKSYLESTKQLIEENHLTKATVVEGCQTRHRSIYAGIKAIEKGCETDVVIIQDGVRLFADEDLIRKVAQAAKNHGAAGVTRSLVSTVISSDQDMFLKESLNRSLYMASEMPQGFLFSVIKTAYDKATDEDFDHGTECLLLAMKHSGTRAKLIEGPDNLWKVTYRKDFFAAEAMLKESLLSVKIVTDDSCQSTYQSICHKLLGLCKDRRITIKTEEDECNSFIFLNGTFCPTAFHKRTSQICTEDECNSFLFLNGTFCPTAFHKKTSQICAKSDCVQIRPCIIHVFTDSNEDVKQLTSTYGEVCETYTTAIHYGILFQKEGNGDILAEMIVDLLWNRTKSLSGQIFTVT